MAQKYAERFKSDCPDIELGELSKEDEKNLRNEVFGEIKRDYDLSAYDDTYFKQKPKTEDDPHAALENAIDKIDENKKLNKKCCAGCSKPNRVVDGSCIKRGQHIVMPGQHFTRFFKSMRKLKRVYDHHAIVKDIKSLEGSMIEIILIHFTKLNERIGVHEETKCFDLGKTEMYIVDYEKPGYDPDTIVSRAESVLSNTDKFQTYNLVTGNCEHFATWCVVGKGESFQVQCLKKKIANGLSRLIVTGSKIAKGIFRLLYISTDEIAAGLREMIPDLVIGGSAILYLIYCITMTVLHIYDFNEGNICRSCLKDMLLDLWLSFSAFGVTTVITCIIFQFALPLMSTGVGIPLMILLLLLSVAFQMSVPKLRKALTSPFTVDYLKVTNLQEVGIGDIISRRYCLYNHLSIVTEVKIANSQPTKGKIKLLHYGWSGSKRKIVEEYFDVDTQESSIHILDCKSLSTFRADDVVSRGRIRIGETKWHISNRSADFVFWAKVHQYDEESYDNVSEEIRRPSTVTSVSHFIKMKEIHRMEDLRVGDVVKVNRNSFGILSSISYCDSEKERKFKMDVYIYTFLWRVTKTNYCVDLNKDRLYVQIYNPTQCQTMEKRVETAKEMENRTGLWWTTNGFIRYCIELKFSAIIV